MTTNSESKKMQYPSENQTSTEQINEEKNDQNNEPDYSKYLPKN